MLTNFHTHTNFCDGENTAEEVVISAIEKGFSSIGFSGHGYTPFDLEYCIKDIDGYIAEIKRLKEKYKGEIQIYLGMEEDAHGEVDRNLLEYIIGSSHYLFLDGQYYPVDLNYDGFKKCIDICKGDVITLADNYYKSFCEYILRRKPDIVGHFDLITKFEETEEPLLFANEEYFAISEKYIKEAAKSGCIFEVNTGAMFRGYRTSPYPSENLLHTLRKNGAGVIISSDCHNVNGLDFKFEEMRKMLKDIGFEYVYTLYDNEFKKDFL